MIAAVKNAVTSGQHQRESHRPVGQPSADAQSAVWILPLYNNHQPRPVPSDIASAPGGFAGTADLPHGYANLA